MPWSKQSSSHSCCLRKLSFLIHSIFSRSVCPRRYSIAKDLCNFSHSMLSPWVKSRTYSETCTLLAKIEIFLNSSSRVFIHSIVSRYTSNLLHIQVVSENDSFHNTPFRVHEVHDIVSKKRKRKEPKEKEKNILILIVLISHTSFSPLVDGDR